MVTTTSTLPISVRPAKGRRFIVEIDRNRLERLAASLGLFRKDFLESLSRAEREVSRGKAKRLRSFRDLRRA